MEKEEWLRPPPHRLPPRGRRLVAERASVIISSTDAHRSVWTIRQTVLPHGSTDWQEADSAWKHRGRREDTSVGNHREVTRDKWKRKACREALGIWIGDTRTCMDANGKDTNRGGLSAPFAFWAPDNPIDIPAASFSMTRSPPWLHFHPHFPTDQPPYRHDG